MITTVIFTRTQRASPIVLTRHQVEKLSFIAGRNVHNELMALREDWFEAKTLGQLMRYLVSILEKS